jgi:DegV family protein with EDD domain
MSRIGVVTDSTAALPAGILDKYDVRVVPLQVVLGGRVGLEGDDVMPADVATALRDRVAVSTSRPTPGQFAAAYGRLAADGAAEIVSVHLSAGLSGTLDSARIAAADAPVPVRVVDSRSTAMGLGFPVLAAAEAAAADAHLDEVVAAADKAVDRTRALFYVSSLEALRRGGRIGQAAALVGSALAVKPLLHIVDGRIALAEKVRTASKAIARLEDLAAQEARSGPVDLAVHHLAAAAAADALADRLRRRIPGVVASYVCEVGAVVGAHVGIGLLGAVIHHR